MNEEITIINSNTRKEKIKNFFVNNKKLLISIFVVSIVTLFSFFSYQIYKDGHKEWLANKYNNAVIEFENGDKTKVFTSIKEIIEDKDSTYSPLGLYFLIDNNLMNNKDEVNYLFDILINETDLELEIQNLLIYKKALYNSDFIKENELIKILSPIINSGSIWKPQALYLLAEFFYSNNEKEKSKEFFNQILTLSNSNSEIKLEVQKRLNRDFSE
jgi:predicted negative regulator of RcsB-dependent stress response